MSGIVDAMLSINKYYTDQLKDHDARIKALEHVRELKPGQVLTHTQADLDAAVAEAKADGKKFSNRPCFTPVQHDVLKAAAVDAAVKAERERCVKVVVDEYRPLSTERPLALCERIMGRIN